MCDNSCLKTLNEELKLELEWRYKEIENIKSIYKNNITIQQRISNIYDISANKEAKFILRSGILILYAHWEGYFKYCINEINDKLDTLCLDLNEVNNLLLSLLFKDKHKLEYRDKQILFKDIIIDTGSNLDWKRLEKLLDIYNFNKKQFEEYKFQINTLVKIRNGIAHGENAYHFDNYYSINKLISTVKDLMFLSRYNTIIFFKLKKYKK